MAWTHVSEGYHIDRFNRGRGAKFEVENYLHHQGHSFTRRFDANTYILMTKALDYFDPAKETNNNLSEVFINAKSKFLLISFSSDWRFPVARSKEITDALIQADKDVSHIIVETDKGHDSFFFQLIDIQKRCQPS